jgi:tetratricopeptide (TPR) repeat protein
MCFLAALPGFGQRPGNAESALRETASRTLNSLGVLYFERQEFEKAKAAFQDALRYLPDDRGIRTNLAMVFYQASQFEKVIELLGGDVDTGNDRRALTALAVSHFALGRYGEAARYYEKLVSALPEDVVLRLTLAASYRLSGQAERAEDLLKQPPDNPQTQARFHVILADAYRNQMKAKEAIAEYETALKLDSTLAEVNYRVGVLYSDLHLYDQAREAFARELQINPQSAEASYSMGAYHLNIVNSVEQASAYFEKTIAANPRHLGGYLGLMKIQLGKGKAAEALELAGKAEANGGDNDELHYLKSRAYNLLGKKDLAAQELKRFEELRSARK